MNTKLRRALAIVGLVCMAIFSVSLVIVLADRTLLNGAFGYIALVSGLLGVAFFLVVKYLLKDKEPPDYLPVPDKDDPETESGEAEQSDAQAEHSEDAPSDANGKAD